jgi:hypothetical protein
MTTVPESSTTFEEMDPVPVHAIPNLLVVLLIGLVGVLFGPWLMVVVFHVFGNATITARLWEWIFILGVETGFWALAAAPIFLSMRKLWLYTGSANVERLKLALFVLILGGLTAVPLVLAKSLGFFSPLDRQFAPLLCLVGIGSLVAAPAVVGIWLVDRCVAQKLGPQRGLVQIATYLRLRRFLETYRTFLGIMLGLAVLAAGVQRAAIVAASHANGFRPVFVLLFGGYNTVLLVLVYVPVYLRLLAMGRRIVDNIEPLPTQDTGWGDALDRRAKLVVLFALETSVTDRLKSALFLLTPVFSSLVVTVVGLGSK